jgi:Histidine-specific methyltransferase, SAM-dependent
MNHWGELFEAVVDAAITADESTSRDEIVAHLEGPTLVPSRYMYSSEAGAANWIHLCKDSTYPLHRETVAFWAGKPGREIAALIQERLGRKDLDFVSLGPGDGKKDAKLVRRWLKSGMDVFYYPYDVSRMLVSKAISTVRESTPPTPVGQFRVKAVLADFSQLGAVRAVLAHRDSPKVVALLGTLGNLENEFEFLDKLKEQMSSNDFLVLEVRLRSNKERPTELTDGNAALRFDFGALESYLGLDFDRKLMTVEQETNASSFSDTITTVVGCENIQYRTKTYPKVRLVYIHEYTEQTFLDELAENGFEVVKHWRRDKGERFLVCVVRLERERPHVD